VAYPVCNDVPQQKCVDVPRQVCVAVPDQVCTNQPLQKCQDVPRQNCQAVHKKVPVRVSRQVPKKVCQGGHPVAAPAVPTVPAGETFVPPAVASAPENVDIRHKTGGNDNTVRFEKSQIGDSESDDNAIVFGN